MYGLGFSKIMDISKEIDLCQANLAHINKVRQGLEADGIPDDDRIYDVVAEKTWFWMMKWELLAAMDPGNRHSFTAAEVCLN